VEAGLSKNLKWNILLGNEFFRQHKFTDIISVNKEVNSPAGALNSVEDKTEGDRLESQANGMSNTALTNNGAETPPNQLTVEQTEKLARSTL
jgi:hypothetical protein